MNKNLIKVRVTFNDPPPGCPAGEYLWAKRVGQNTAKIDSIPYATAKVAKGDLVQITSRREVTMVLESTTRTRLLRYANPMKMSVKEAQDKLVKLKEELQKHDIESDGKYLGMCSIAVPRDMKDTELEKLAEQLEVDVIYHEDGD